MTDQCRSCGDKNPTERKGVWRCAPCWSNYDIEMGIENLDKITAFGHCMCGRKYGEHYSRLIEGANGKMYCRKREEYVYVPMPEPFASDEKLRGAWLQVTSHLWRNNVSPMKAMRTFMETAEKWNNV